MSSILFRLYWTIISMFFDIFSSFRFLRVVWSFDYVFPHVFWFLLGGLGWFFGFIWDCFFPFCVFFWNCFEWLDLFFYIWFWFFEIFWVVGLLFCLSAFCMRADGISHPLTESERSESITPHVRVSHPPPPTPPLGVRSDCTATCFHVHIVYIT